jgi:MoaA/NifB/PqqE/SkfB family radical SAM enzyme
VGSKNISDNALNNLIEISKRMPKSINAANIVVSHKNLEELIKLIKFLDSKNIWSTFVPVNLAETKDNYLFKAKAEEFSFDSKDKKNAGKIYNDILKLKKQGYKILISSKFLKQSSKFIQDGNKKWKCDAGELYFSIFPDGSFSPCDEIPTDLNILNKDFLEKYKSKKFKKFLHLLQKNCEGCFYGCWKETSNLINSPSVICDRFLTILRVNKKNISKKIK